MPHGVSGDEIAKFACFSGLGRVECIQPDLFRSIVYTLGQPRAMGTRGEKSASGYDRLSEQGRHYHKARGSI